MTFTYGFYNSVGGDRTYDAVQMSNIVKGIIIDGIFPQIGTAMRVTNGGGLIANVGIGKAWFNGTWSDNDAVLPITLDTADALLPRIDLIVLEIDTNTGVRANSIKFVKGTPNSVPVAPTPITGALKNQYVLATCRVNAGATTIALITDFVGTVGTPYTANGLDIGLPKASAAEVAAGTVDTKYVTPKAIKDSVSVPNVAPGAIGNVMRSTGTSWTSQPNDGWIPDANTWSYSSFDGPTGIASVNADMTGKIQNGMRLKFNQTRALDCYMPLDANSNSSVGSFSMADTAMTYTSGKISNAATFNGTTSKIVVTDHAAFKPTVNSFAFTLALWVKSNTSGASQMIFQSYSQNTAVAGISLSLETSGKLLFVIGKNTGTTLNVDYSALNSRTTVGDNVWHYVVVTITKTGYVQLYVDGQLDVFAATVGAVFAATNYVRFGCKNITGTDINFFTGQIDDVYVLLASVTEETIQAKYLLATAQGTTITDTKKSIVTKVGAYSGGATLITSFYGVDSEISGGPISSPYYSYQKAPFGFNVNPDKWRVIAQFFSSAVFTKVSPTLNNWYGGTQLSPTCPAISAPIGMWDIDVRANITIQNAGTVADYGVAATLSNAETTEAYPDFTATFKNFQESTGNRSWYWSYVLHVKNFVCFTKQSLTINLQSWFTASGNISINTSRPIPTIVLTCSYL